MDFKELFRTLRRRWRTITAFVVLALLASIFFSIRATPQYESTAKIFVTTDNSSVQDQYALSLYALQSVKTYATLADQTVFLQRVKDQLGDSATDAKGTLTLSELATKITAEVEPETKVLVLKIVDSDPDRAKLIAEVAAEQLTEYIKELEKPSTSDTPQVLPQITNYPIRSNHPISPRPVLNAVLAIMVGFAVGCAVAIARELLDQTVKTDDDVQKAAGVPLMTAVGMDSTVAASPLLTDLATFSPRAEAFRLLRTNLQYLDLDEPPRSIVITSAISGEGKTTASTNLAVALAQAGRRVLLVDGDLRRPRVAQVMGLEGAVGLTTVLVGRSKLEDSVQRHAASGVHVLTSGPTPPNPSEILQARATHDLLARLREAYDMVIIDAPPLLPVADAAILATATDGAIIVTRHGKTTREQLDAAAHRLKSVGARTFGVVLNMVPKRFGELNYYYYYYAEEASPKGAKASSANN